MRFGMGNRIVAARFAFWLVVFAFPFAEVRAQQSVDGGQVSAIQDGNSFRLENQAIGARWSVADSKLGGLVIADRLDHTDIPVAVPFAILLKDSSIHDSADMKLAGPPAKRELMPQPNASRAADHLHGVQFSFPLESGDHSLQAE